MNPRKALFACAFVAIAAGLFAQAGTTHRLVLEYVEGENLTVVRPDSVTLAYGVGILEGETIPVGSLITTGSDTAAELMIKPNGTIIKLSRGTTFRVESLASGEVKVNTFSLVSGKIRSVAAKGTGAEYIIKTSTTVCAVRGTDFTLAFEAGRKAMLMVAEGSVAYGLYGSGGAMQNIMVGAGQFADGYSAAFAPAAYTPEQYKSEYGDSDFKKLMPSDVPGAKTAAAPDSGEPADSGEEPAEGTPEDTDKAVAGVKNEFMEWLTDILGMEIGSITIDGNTYSKAVLQPVLKFDKLEMALYLPIIYTDDLFNPANWYKPAGNNEWDFGFPMWETDPLAALLDAGTDLMLKFKYIEYGEQMVDPFYLKVGNIGDMTLGHGLVMYRYANDHEFPAVRRLGFNVGFDNPDFALELMLNDLTDPEIFGGRFAYKIIKDSLAIGLTAVVDAAPARMLDTAATPNASSAVGDPVFIGTAIDFDLPIIKSNDIFSMRAYLEGAVQFPWTRTDIGTIAAGPQFSVLFNETGFNNFGAIMGVMGNALFVDYRLEFRYYRGTFKPNFYGPTYDLARGRIAQDYAAYVTNPGASDKPSVFGIYGEAGFELLDDKLVFSAGYMWPWSLDAGISLASQLEVARNDYLHLELVVEKGLIPFLDISGSISYDRTNFARTILGLEGANVYLFDANTTLQGELVVPVPDAPGLSLAVIFATAPVRNPDGSIVFSAPNVPEIAPVISIESRISF